MDINTIISYIISPELQARIWPVKIAFIGVSLFFLGAIVVLLLRTNWLKFRFLETLVEFFLYRPYGYKKLARKWAKVLSRLERGSESEFKLAVIEANDMLEGKLKDLGYEGKNLEERLGKLSPVILPNLEEVKKAIEVRNNIIRNPDYRLSLDEARKTLAIYEQALRDLGF